MTTARYDGLAEWYDREFANDGPARQTVLRLLGEGTGRLLDAGCGTGAHSVAFAERGWDVVGLDISTGMLSALGERHPSVARVCADGQVLPLRDDAVETLVGRLFPLATVVTPNLHEAHNLVAQSHKVLGRAELAEAIHALGAPAVIVTGGHGEEAVDHLFDGDRHVEIPVARHDVRATHGAGCTHSATLAAHLARGSSLEESAYAAARAASEAVRHGFAELGAGEGPVDVLNVEGAA